MPGGLLNIIAYGNANIILNGNPSKTFFRTVYAKYTNFGMQNFRIDYNGSRDIDPNNDSVYTFKIPRHAELLMDAYFVFTIPNIWSTILPPIQTGDIWKAYQFKWIENLGTSILKKIEIFIGTDKIQEYTGEYIRCMVERDYNEDKKKMFDIMTGNVNELKKPELWGSQRKGDRSSYPNAFFLPNDVELNGVEPSIRGRKIYVPLSCWFCKSSKLALPLVALQYHEVTIQITVRPLREIYTINNVLSITKYSDKIDGKKEDGTLDKDDIYTQLTRDFYNRIQPNYTIDRHQLYRFLQPPPSIDLLKADYINYTNNWDADVHLIAKYGFLTMEESNVFALNEQRYLIKEVKETIHYNIADNRKIKLDTNALVSNWMWFYRRNDAYIRNEWSNYTNWKTSEVPYDLKAEENTDYLIPGAEEDVTIGPGYDLLTDGQYENRRPTGHYVLPTFSEQYERDILMTFSIVLDGKFRENELDAGVYNYIEKYRSTNSSNDLGIYNYNFCLDTPNYLQPTGAINLNRFRNIEMEMTTITPPKDPNAESIVLCDENGGVIGVTREQPLYLYTFDMHLFEERYNVLRIMSGKGGLLFAH